MRFATASHAAPPPSDYDNAGRSDGWSGGARMIPIHAPKGDFNVWVKRTGNNPRLKVLLLHGGPAVPHEYLEVMDSFLPAVGIEYYFYDQLGAKSRRGGKACAFRRGCGVRPCLEHHGELVKCRSSSRGQAIEVADIYVKIGVPKSCRSVRFRIFKATRCCKVTPSALCRMDGTCCSNSVSMVASPW